MNQGDILFQIIILVFSVIIHEISHGYAALALGDNTAKYAGRLTLNPIPHIDLFGSILIPAILIFSHSPFLIGWAKPVPYNPYNLRNQKWGPALVGAAGPLANLGIALFFSILVRVLSYSPFNSFEFAANLAFIAAIIVLLNISLALFNLVPIPPLDGSKVLFGLLPYHLRFIEEFLERYGFLLLVIFIISFSDIMRPLIFFVFHIFVGQ